MFYLQLHFLFLPPLSLSPTFVSSSMTSGCPGPQVLYPGQCSSDVLIQELLWFGYEVSSHEFQVLEA
jgi:hypothetical protein